MTDNTKPTGLALLRVPFPDHQIGKLAKASKAQNEAAKANRELGVSCRICHTFHHKNAVHLDYVGHAAVTDRLLEADSAWNWEPVAFGENGLPQFDNLGGLWIRLTVCGVTRYGYGNADPKGSYADVGAREKEVIGDALRNAAMRFGVALDLWHKGELHPPEVPKDDTPPGPDDPPFDGHPADVPSRQDAAPPPPPATDGKSDYPKDEFAKDFPAWKTAVEAGKKTAAQVIAMASSRYRLNPVQKAKIEALRLKG